MQVGECTASTPVAELRAAFDELDRGTFIKHPRHPR